MSLPVFVTTIYGADYMPFLAPHLHSVRRCHPESKGAVLWQGCPPHEIDLLARCFTRRRFMESEAMLAGHKDQRISRKLHLWRLACHHYPEDAICFTDSDILFVRPIHRFLSDDFDILFTWKPETYPINTGFMLLRNGRIGERFFSEWVRLIEAVVGDPARLEEALKMSGAADQHTLRTLIGFRDNYDGLFERQLAGQTFVFKGVPCRFLNETNCRPITDDTHVIHYKSGWHRILLHGAPFGGHRPAQQCRQMYDFWRETARTANQKVIHAIVEEATRQHVARFKPLATSFEERGILHSEMLAVCAVCDELKIEVIIESGRARGQSTYMLARYFAGRPLHILSIDWEQAGYFRAEDDAFARQRLEPFPNVELLYGDSVKLIPDLLRRFAGKRIAILLDGPKGQVAIDLLKDALCNSNDIVAAFFHDMKKGFPQRQSMEQSFARVLFTDDPQYVATFAELDRSCQPAAGATITQSTWRPYMKGHERTESYGPTLAVVLPMVAEGQRYRHNRWQEGADKGWRLLKTFGRFVRQEGVRATLRRSWRWLTRRI